jgi:predicted O-methyltransferase YrrM
MTIFNINILNIQYYNMSFNSFLPSDYYQCNIVTSFNKNEDTKTDYTLPIYMRNPRVNCKLSLNHIELIEYFVRLIKPKNFLELGVQFGECVNKIVDLIPVYYGVDIEKNTNIEYLIANKPNFKFFQLSTNDFFNNIKNNNINLNLDMVFIDADHSHKSSYTDFLNVKDHMNQDGFIFFHDCYPFSIKDTDPGLCGDCFKTSEVIRKHHNNEFEILTIPVFPGLSIARKCTKQLNWL